MSDTVLKNTQANTVVKFSEAVTTVKNVDSVTVLKISPSNAVLKVADVHTVLKFTGGAPGAPGAQGDPGEGVPAGGTALQLLTKIDGVDFNTQWSDFAALFGAYVADLPVADSDASSGLATGEPYLTSADHIQAPGGLIKFVE